MHLLEVISNWVNRQLGVKPKELPLIKGLRFYDAGEMHFREENFQEAMSCFDTAIACGCHGGVVYERRGMCLQRLGYELDAIDDFNKAIAARPEDANLYFLRSLSRDHTGDLDGAVSDVEEAVRLSKAKTSDNDSYNDYAKETGWPSVTAFYESRLGLAQACNSELGHICAEDRRRKESSSWRRTCHA